MTKKNPFRVVEKIFTIIGMGLFLAILGFLFLGMPVIGVVTQTWELVYMPYVMVAAYAVGTFLIVYLSHLWRDAKNKWEARND